MNGNQTTIGPVANIKCLLVLHGEFCTGTEDNTCRTTDADRRRLRQAIRIIVRPLRAAFSEAVIATTNGMENMDRPIPGHSPVPFHITVEAKQFAVGIETNVIRVALT